MLAPGTTPTDIQGIPVKVQNMRAQARGGTKWMSQQRANWMSQKDKK